jgi:hypothetical protein
MSGERWSESERGADAKQQLMCSTGRFVAPEITLHPNADDLASLSYLPAFQPSIIRVIERLVWEKQELSLLAVIIGKLAIKTKGANQWAVAHG